MDYKYLKVIRLSRLKVNNIMGDDKLSNGDLPELPQELHTRLISGERSNIEWKKSWAEKDEIKEAMLSFANQNGGTIFVGVDEKKDTEGIIQPDFVDVSTPTIPEIKSNIRQWAGSNFSPPIVVEVNSYIIESKRIDVLEVQASNEKPVCLGRGLYRIRTTDGSRALLPSDLREIILGKENYKIALIEELKYNIEHLKNIRENLLKDPAVIVEEGLQTIVIQAILVNGHLSLYFNFKKLRHANYVIEMLRRNIERAVIGTVTQSPGFLIDRAKRNVSPVISELQTLLTELESL